MFQKSKKTRLHLFPQIKWSPWTLFSGLSWVALVWALSSCGGNAASSSSSSSSSSASSATVSPLSVTVSSVLDGSATTVGQGTCQISATATAPASNSCTITIPELDLYFSSLSFAVTTSSDTICALVSFRPYSFLASVSSTYVANTESPSTTTDCSVTPTNILCYGGPAKDIITGFPTYGGTYFIPNPTALTSTYTISSANSKLGTSPGFRNYQNNSYTANDYPVASRGTALVGGSTGGVDFVGGASNYVDYEFSCQDPWGSDLYSLTLTITTSDASPVDNLDCNPSSILCRFWHWNNDF